MLCWPVIASETENESVRGTAADIALQSVILAPCPASNVDLEVFPEVPYLRVKTIGRNVTRTHSVHMQEPSEAVKVLLLPETILSYLHLME